MGSQPNHRDVCSALNELCAQTTFDVEAQLVEQKELDEAEARRLAEEEKKREEMTRLLAEQEEKVKQMEQDQRDIEAVERELDARKQALHDAQKAADIDDDDNDDDDDDERDSESTAEGRQVCPYCCILILSHTYNNNQLH